MASCIACGAELEPSVRALHAAVYVKTLYRIGSQDYRCHHVIRAAVVADIITEVRPGSARRPGVTLVEFARDKVVPLTLRTALGAPWRRDPVGWP